MSDQRHCEDCGRMIPATMRLCPNCYALELQRRKQTAENIKKGIDKSNKRFLYGD